ncbi:hypothetical protein [Stenotrophomonas rhizophila]|jgi:hypothetical protein|uniref:hypothetical protein n=1 Tax=Stenotrophomonas rhizophila TaxID=216778 RepID=UPI00201CC770|nr:hypothetical protein [Stenotrophomonas rhizophila]UQY86605.1 hypothetical protein LQE85_14065 [Stenotrophomonas rhizophila]
MPLEVAQSTPIAPARSDRFDLSRAVKKIPLDRVANADLPAPCQMSRVTGVHRQNAHSGAVSVCYDIMDRARAGLSGRDLDAMNRSLQLLGRKATEHFGNLLQMHLTAAGALHAGVSMRLDETPDDAALIRCRRKLEDSIIAMGIKAGRCKTVPDGGYHGDKRSAKLTDAMAVAKQRMLECAKTIPMAGLLEDVAAAILPGPLMDSIRERQENPHLFAKGEGGADVMQVLQKKMCDDLEKILQAHIDAGSVENLMVAILDLLKLPEYIVEGDPGRAGTPEPPRDRSELPRDLQRLIHDGNGHGGCTNINHSPTNIDFSEFGKALERAQLPLQELFNLFDRSRADAYELGRLTEIVRHQDQRIDKQDQRIHKLERMLNESQQRYETFANGAGGARVPRGTQARPDVLDQGTSTSDLPPKNEPAPPVSPHGVNAGNGNGVVRADQETETKQRDLLDNRNQFDHSTGSARNSQNGEGARHLRRNVDSQGNQKDTRTLGSQGNQNEQADRQIRNASVNQLSPDGRLDDTAHPAAQQQRGHQLQGRDETDHSNSRLQRQQRLGSTQQRLEGQHDERNRRLQDRNDGNRLGNAHAPFVAAGPYQEYKHYLNSLKIDVGPLEPDPFAPTSERSYQADRPWDPVNGFSSMRQIMPSDVKEYVKERGENAGTPFVPFMKGKVRPVPVQEDTELQKAFDAFFTKSRLISPDPRNAAAPSVQQSQGEGAVPSVRSPGVEAVKPPAPRMSMSRREEEQLVPAFVRAGVAEGRRSADVRSPLAPAGTGRALHAQLLPNGPLGETSRPARASGIPPLAPSVTLPSDNFRNSLLRGRSDSVFSNASSTLNPLTLEAIRGSRIPGATLTRQDSFDDAVESLREDESITIDSTPHGTTSYSESPQSDQSRDAASPSEHARTSQLFTRSVSELSLDSDDGIDADTFAQMIIKGSRVSRGSITRQQSDVELAASRVKQWELKEEFGPGWGQPASGAASSISSSESSLSDRLDEDFPVIEPDTDVVDTAEKWKRAASAESHDSGNESPTRLTESNGADATLDPQPIVGVGNRIAPGAAFMAELKQRTALQVAS